MTVTKERQDLIARLRAVQHGAYNAYASSVAQEAADTLAALSSAEPVAYFDPKEVEWLIEQRDYQKEHEDIVDAASITAAIKPLGKMTMPLYAAPAAPQVKPLEWVWDNERAYGRGVPGLSYSVRRLGSSFVVYVGDDENDMLPGEFENMSAARFASQMDYEQHILSTPPADEWAQVVSRLTQERDEARDEVERHKWHVDKAHRLVNASEETAKHFEARVKALEEAGKNVIASASDAYKKRNGQIATLEDDSGEKSWIVPYETLEDLRAALKGGEA